MDEHVPVFIFRIATVSFISKLSEIIRINGIFLKGTVSPGRFGKAKQKSESLKPRLSEASSKYVGNGIDGR